MAARSRLDPVRRGALAQAIAASYLELKGYSVLDANRRAAGGEVDLVVRRGTLLVFVEVRLRGVGALVGAAASVDRRKLGRLRSCAAHLARTRPDLSWPHRVLRLDVVALDLGPGGLRLEHLEGVGRH
jgi:putative endonuclease